MLVNEYETTLILRPELAGEAIESTLDRVRDSVKKMDGTLLDINHWGRKKLAYPIEKQTRGIYIHTHYLGKDNLVAEVERNLRISDSVMRYLTIRLEQGITGTELEVQEYVAPEYGAESEEDTEAPRSAPVKAAAPAEAAPAAPAETVAAPTEEPAAEKAAASEEAPATEEGDA
jgi:small subunit ribosomal protein S6